LLQSCIIIEDRATGGVVYKTNSKPRQEAVAQEHLQRIGTELRPIPDEVIDYLKHGEDDSDQLRHDDDWPHQPGDQVLVLEGPFAGLTGIYKMPLPESRAILLLELLGRKNPVTVDIESLAAT
jgi:transcriptional antiterminator RfaH